MEVQADWRTIAKRAQEHRDASIHSVQPPVPAISSDLPLRVVDIPQQVLTAEELAITERTPEGLLSALASGELTSVQVTTAFSRRAGLAQSLANCVTELLPERALERARTLDDFYKQHGKPVGPLHGLPISVKEHIAMKGLSWSAGFAAWYDRLAEEDATLLKLLWRAGCVFYARTTEPQLLMHLETSSNLYGTTVNPYNRTLTAGGSSGGESALLALRGSCLGIGTDIGGSVRSPAANCGIYSLRCTTHRIPSGGIEDMAKGQEQILGIVGPMSTSLEGLRLFMKTVIDSEPHIMQPLERIAWKESVCPEYSQHQKLRVAVMSNDGVVQPHPPVTRALLEVVSKLRKLNWIELIEWKPYRHDEAWRIISTLYYPDGGILERSLIEQSGEPWLPLSKFILLENPNAQPKTVEQNYNVVDDRDKYRAAYHDHWNNTASHKPGPDSLPVDWTGMVDVILCPVGPSVAPKLDTSTYWGYTSQWNLLDYPALVFPVSKVDLEKDVWPEGSADDVQFLSEKDRENRALWKDGPAGPKDFEGAPIGLQLVGRRYDDEKLLEIFSKIQTAINLPFVKP